MLQQHLDSVVHRKSVEKRDAQNYRQSQVTRNNDAAQAALQAAAWHSGGGQAPASTTTQHSTQHYPAAQKKELQPSRPPAMPAASEAEARSAPAGARVPLPPGHTKQHAGGAGHGQKQRTQPSDRVHVPGGNTAGRGQRHEQQTVGAGHGQKQRTQLSESTSASSTAVGGQSHEQLVARAMAKEQTLSIDGGFRNAGMWVYLVRNAVLIMMRMVWSEDDAPGWLLSCLVCDDRDEYLRMSGFTAFDLE